MGVRIMDRQKPNRRRYVYSARRDPIVHVDYEHYAGSWEFVERLTGWRPTKSVVVHRSRLDAKTLEWLKNFDKQ